jgi:glycosyltransferase involved in cell wall biosynthesis
MSLVAGGFGGPSAYSQHLSFMKIAYVSIDHPANINAWSGINARIATALRCQDDVELLRIGPLRTRSVLVSKCKALITPFVFKKRYLWTRDPVLLRAYARRAERLLEGAQFDVVFSPGTEAIAYLRTDKPMAFWTDAPFAAMLNYYPWYSGLSNASAREGIECDDRALSNCRLAIYSSEWAAKSAIHAHRGAPARIHVLPFGANLESTLTDAELETLIPLRQAMPWRFLLVGVDWTRKGVDIVLDVVRELNRRGYPSELVVAGCQPPVSIGSLPFYLRLEGFLDQRTRKGEVRLGELYRSASFYFMPSLAEAFGIVFCEAASFGVPCLATDTGGIPSLVENGVNGRRFAPGTSTADYIEFILSTMNSGSYQNLSRQSLMVSRKRLNWNVSAASLTSLLRIACQTSEQPNCTSTLTATDQRTTTH